MKRMHGTILLVEDEHLTSTKIAEELLESGYAVVQGYPTLQRGLHHFVEMMEKFVQLNKIKLILMDIKLGKRYDGIEIAREYLQKYGIPIIFITGYLDREYFSRAKITEPYGIIVKPYAATQLITQVELALFISRSRKFRELDFRYASLHDDLTGLPNRKLLNSELSATIKANAGQAGKFAVIFCDLDNFKEINDRFGHITGDHLLQEVARRFQNAVKKSDLVVRFGGDEFVFLIRELETPEQVHPIAQRIIESLQEPIHLGKSIIQAKASLGIAIQDAALREAQVIIKNADTAMYDAKKNPQLRYSVFKDSDASKSMARLKIEEELKKSIHDAGLTLSFRPILSISPSGVFALDLGINWKNYNSGMLSEAEYLETAERTGLTIPMTVKILYAVSSLLEVWKDRDLEGIFVNIKLGERFLDLKEWDKLILLVVSQKKINPKNLCFEILESVFFKKPAKNYAALAHLRSLEFNIILEQDSGLTSVSRITSVPANFIKIQKRTLGINTGPADFEIYREQVEKSGKFIIADGFTKKEVKSRLGGVNQYFLQKAFSLRKIESLTFKGTGERE